jgi:hypothetical protein
VEPICRVLAVAASTYYAVAARPASARAVRDAALKTRILTVYNANFQVYADVLVMPRCPARGLERLGGVGLWSTGRVGTSA